MCQEQLCDKNDKNAAMIQIHTHLPQKEGVIFCYFQFTVHLANALKQSFEQMIVFDKFQKHIYAEAFVTLLHNHLGQT